MKNGTTVLKQQKKEKEENKEEEEEKQRKIQARQLKYTARYKRRLEQFKWQEQQALDQEENHMAKDKGITKVQNKASPNIFVNALPFIGSRVILLCVSQTSIIGILTAVDEQKGTISLEDVQLADEDGSIRIIELPPDFLKSKPFNAMILCVIMASLGSVVVVADIVGLCTWVAMCSSLGIIRIEC